MSNWQATFQIGKKGLTSGVIGSIKTGFKTHNDAKICILKSAGHDKQTAKEIAEKIVSELGNKYTYKIIGFTIFVKKWRKARKGL